jgi:ferredoxin--NADP+ reductase
MPTIIYPIPSIIDKFGTVVCAGGCYGIGALFPVAKALKEAGNRVISILEAKSTYLLYWKERIKSISDALIVTTEDATTGEKGHAPRILEKILRESKVNKAFAYGCTFMMMECSKVTKPFGVDIRVSLNPIMVDGTGMCGVCRVPIAGKVRFACVDGPEFNGHEVDWEVLLSRRHSYMDEEVHSLKCYETEQFS